MYKYNLQQNLTLLLLRIIFKSIFSQRLALKADFSVTTTSNSDSTLEFEFYLTLK
jgi:hypothetical protein